MTTVYVWEMTKCHEPVCVKSSVKTNRFVIDMEYNVKTKELVLTMWSGNRPDYAHVGTVIAGEDEIRKMHMRTEEDGNLAFFLDRHVCFHCDWVGWHTV